MDFNLGSPHNDLRHSFYRKLSFASLFGGTIHERVYPPMVPVELFIIGRKHVGTMTEGEIFPVLQLKGHSKSKRGYSATQYKSAFLFLFF